MYEKKWPFLHLVFGRDKLSIRSRPHCIHNSSRRVKAERTKTGLQLQMFQNGGWNNPVSTQIIRKSLQISSKVLWRKCRFSRCLVRLTLWLLLCRVNRAECYLGLLTRCVAVCTQNFLLRFVLYRAKQKSRYITIKYVWTKNNPGKFKHTGSYLWAFARRVSVRSLRLITSLERGSFKHAGQTSSILWNSKNSSRGLLPSLQWWRILCAARTWFSSSFFSSGETKRLNEPKQEHSQLSLKIKSEVSKSLEVIAVDLIVLRLPSVLLLLAASAAIQGGPLLTMKHQKPYHVNFLVWLHPHSSTCNCKKRRKNKEWATRDNLIKHGRLPVPYLWPSAYRVLLAFLAEVTVLLWNQNNVITTRVC